MVLWRDPGDMAIRDLAGGPLGKEGVPAPPFVFQEEEGGGSNPKILVRDANGRLWEAKWGEEVKSEPFVTRLIWAVGYIVEPEYYVASGRISDVGALKRAAHLIDRSNGNSFRNSRFELRNERWLIVPGQGWLLNQNPFIGTNELQGLKIMSMLVSDWDLKDPRSPDGSNTAMMRYEGGPIEYIVNDWGATMGKWGGVAKRSKWDCKGYRSEDKEFVKGVDGNTVRFGYEGKLTGDVAKGITVDNVRWLMQYLGKISDEQLRGALEASGANSEAVGCFVPAIRERIEALRAVAGNDATH